MDSPHCKKHPEQPLIVLKGAKGLPFAGCPKCKAEKDAAKGKESSGASAPAPSPSPHPSPTPKQGKVVRGLFFDRREKV